MAEHRIRKKLLIVIVYVAVACFGLAIFDYYQNAGDAGKNAYYEMSPVPDYCWESVYNGDKKTKTIHASGSKCAEQIDPNGAVLILKTESAGFLSVKEAQEKGYVFCPVCTVDDY